MSNQSHWTILKEAWNQESDKKKERQEKLEKDFLPAALEILEKPPSPIGRLISFTIMAFVIIGLLWASFGKLDIVASAPGRILPRERVKVVQASEIGVVREIFVTDGQFVKKGDVLINLEEADAGADEEQARQQLLLAHITIVRGEAMLDYLDGKEPILNFNNIDVKDISERLKERQRAWVNAQINEHEARAQSLQEQRSEKRAEISVNQKELKKVRLRLPLLSERVESQKSLLEQELIPRQTYLTLQEEYISLQNDAEIIEQRQSLTDASIRAIEQQLTQIEEEFRKNILAEMAEAEAQIGLSEQELSKRSARRGLRSLVTPIDGVVQQLSVHTKGGVVPPAEPLMVIVPEGGELIVETTILNKDIGFVDEGDIVEVKLEAFPFTKYGIVPGVVESLSRDAIQDENLGLVFQGRIKLGRQEIRINGKQVSLSAGMMVTAEIKTGKRRVIEYVLAPLLRYKDEALRER